MTRTRRFLGGLAFGYANQAMVILVGLWLTAFLLARLGQADYGLWLVGTRILGYLLLLDVGIVALLPRETAFATGRAGGAVDPDALAEIVGRTTRLVFWQLPVVTLAAAVVWMALPTDWAPLKNPIGIVMVVFVVQFPSRILQATLNGLQELSFLGAVYTITWILGTALTVSLVLAGWGLYALAVGWSTGQLLSSVLWWMRLRSKFPGVVRASFPRFPRDQLRDRLSRSAWISVQQVSQVLLQGTDLLIVGKVMGPEAVVPYFCTAKVLTVLGHQPQMLAHTAQPALSELRTSPDRHRLADVCTALTRAILILSGAIVCVVIAVNEGFVRWWVGADQYGGFLLTVILLSGMLLRHWNVTATYSLFAFAHDRRISITSLADGVLSVTAAIVLVHRYGLAGAAAGTLVGVLLVGLPANLAGLAKEMQVRASSLVLALWPWAWRFALVTTLAVVSQMVWLPDTIPALVVTTLAIGALYAALMLPLALQDPLGLYVRPRLDTLKRIILRETATVPQDG